MAQHATGRFWQPPRRVAILRALQLGDLLCAVPVFRALRAAWPRSEIVLVGLPWARQFASRFDCYLDGFREFPGYPGLPEREPDVEGMPRFLSAMQQERFDLAIQLHGSGSHVNPVVALLGARRSAGFYVPGEYCPDPETYIPWPRRGLEVHRLLALLSRLNVEARGDEFEFPLHSEDFRSLHALPQAARLEKSRFACLHAGASTPSRRWPPDKFAAVADALAGKGLTIVLTGVESERAVTAAVLRNMNHPAIDLTGQTELETLAALVRGAALVVCNDTGISHLAAALRVPSVVISTGDNPARWAPIDRDLHRVLCDPDGVTVAAVQRAARLQLARARPLQQGRLSRRSGQPPGSLPGVISTAYAGGV